MLVVGIDEAGYGPLLGPLVVAGVAFRVEDAGTGVAGWGEHFGERFEAAMRAAGLQVGDSKRIFGVTRDLATLEGPLLAFLSGVTCLDTLLTAVGVDPAVRGAAPWYSGELEFPCRCKADEVRESAGRLNAALALAGIEFLGFAADVIPEKALNTSYKKANKADALFGVASGVYERLASRRRLAEPLGAVFDRHGGRHFYAALLQQRWPDTFTSVLVETPTRSDYRLHHPDAEVHVSFRVEADDEFPQVGLASMLAKYLREVFMQLFNGHFARICPEVRPTAGYRPDGRRWLKASRAARRAAGVPDSELVRRR